MIYLFLTFSSSLLKDALADRQNAAYISKVRLAERWGAVPATEAAVGPRRGSPVSKQTGNPWPHSVRNKKNITLSLGSLLSSRVYGYILVWFLPRANFLDHRWSSLSHQVQPIPPSPPQGEWGSGSPSSPAWERSGSYFSVILKVLFPLSVTNDCILKCFVSLSGHPNALPCEQQCKYWRCPVPGTYVGYSQGQSHGGMRFCL